MRTMHERRQSRCFLRRDHIGLVFATPKGPVCCRPESGRECPADEARPCRNAEWGTDVHCQATRPLEVLPGQKPRLHLLSPTCLKNKHHSRSVLSWCHVEKLCHTLFADIVRFNGNVSQPHNASMSRTILCFTSKSRCSQRYKLMKPIIRRQKRTNEVFVVFLYVLYHCWTDHVQGRLSELCLWHCLIGPISS